jgi:hypothetical protein
MELIGTCASVFDLSGVEPVGWVCFVFCILLVTERSRRSHPTVMKADGREHG